MGGLNHRLDTGEMRIAKLEVTSEEITCKAAKNDKVRENTGENRD